MNLKYVCYDGVEGDVTFHQTKKDAIKGLKILVENSLEDGEWLEGIENSFIAKITHKIEDRKVEPPQEYKKYGIDNFIEMDVKKA